MASIASRGRADEDDSLRRAAGKRRVLREKAVAGMNRLDAGFTRDLEDAILVEVALRRHGRAERIRFVRLDMCGTGIGIGVDGNRRDAHLPQGPRDPHGDLAPVRDQHLSEQWFRFCPPT